MIFASALALSRKPDFVSMLWEYRICGMILTWIYHYCGFVYTTVNANTTRRELECLILVIFAQKQNGSDNNDWF